MTHSCPECGHECWVMDDYHVCEQCGHAFWIDTYDRYDAAEEKAGHEYHFAKDEGLI